MFKQSSRGLSWVAAAACASEANAVIQNFNALSVPQQTAILDFLRAL